MGVELAIGQLLEWWGFFQSREGIWLTFDDIMIAEGGGSHDVCFFSLGWKVMEETALRLV